MTTEQQSHMTPDNPPASSMWTVPLSSRLPQLVRYSTVSPCCGRNHPSHLQSCIKAPKLLQALIETEGLPACNNDGDD